MIVWPHNGEVTEQARKALDAFKKSGLCAELEDDGQKWRFRSFARSPEPPARMVLRSDSGETRILTLQQTGYWVRVVDQDVRPA
jgi:hypothetical protein